MKNFQDLVQEALKKVPEVDIYQLKEKIESNKQIKLIDIREDREWVSGRIPSAFHIGRGVLEKGIFEVADSEDEIIALSKAAQIYMGAGCDPKKVSESPVALFTHIRIQQIFFL